MPAAACLTWAVWVAWAAWACNCLALAQPPWLRSPTKSPQIFWPAGFFHGVCLPVPAESHRARYRLAGDATSGSPAGTGTRRTSLDLAHLYTITIANAAQRTIRRTLRPGIACDQTDSVVFRYPFLHILHFKRIHRRSLPGAPSWSFFLPTTFMALTTYCHCS